MRLLPFSLMGLQLVYCLPQANRQPALSGCNVINTDPAFPAPNVWESAMPGIVSRSQYSAAGVHPDYHFVAKSSEDVQKAVNFARDHNVRFTVLNSGHDFLGRNDAPSGLSLDVSRLGGIRIASSFTPSTQGAISPASPAQPENVTLIPGKQAVVTFGAGVSTQDLNDALAPSNLFTMGAAHGEVRVAGGWAQTAGHGPFTTAYGLGADNVLEYKVITADGAMKVANKVSNPDLFWALRGGGGGTFGVVTEATIKAFPSPNITTTLWFINATDPTQTDGLYDAAAYMHSQFPDLTRRGVSGYYYIYPNAMQGVFLTHGAQSGAANSNSTWDPILNKMQSFPGLTKVISTSLDAPSYKTWFDAIFGPADDDMDNMDNGGGSTADPAKRSIRQVMKPYLFKRHEDDELAVANGITPLDSRLLDESALMSPDLAKALKSSMPMVPDGQLRGNLVSGGKVHLPDEPTSVTPAWRTSFVHLIASGIGNFSASPLRQLAPLTGAYANEASAKNPDYKAAFWGINYPNLSAIKSKYDPTNLFWVSPGINADKKQAIDGRVCDAPVGSTINSLYAPANDNKNLHNQTEDSDANGPEFPILAPQPSNLPKLADGSSPEDTGNDNSDGGEGDSGTTGMSGMNSPSSGAPSANPSSMDSPMSSIKRAKRAPTLAVIPSAMSMSMIGSSANNVASSSTGAPLAPASGMSNATDDGAAFPLPSGFFEYPNLSTEGSPVTEGATVTKISYGPFTCAAQDMASNIVTNMKMPCSDCYLTAIQAGLEYPNGTTANIDTGAWLHHIVAYNSGYGKRDTVCPTGFQPQRVFASGNERAVIRINGKYNYGMKIDSGDSLGLLYELMNMSQQDQQYVVSITYEWIPASSAVGQTYRPATMAWLDITGCGSSEVPAQGGEYTKTSPGWSSTVSGKLLSAVGHVHDGGMDTTVYVNGKPVCVSQQIYGRKPGYNSTMDMTASTAASGSSSSGFGGGLLGMLSALGGLGGTSGLEKRQMQMGPTTHISDAGACVDFGEVAVGDELTQSAHYNTNLHPLDMEMGAEAGQPMEIMGITPVYIGT